MRDEKRSGADEMGSGMDPKRSGSDQERHAAGMKMRRAVLGDEHVDRAQANKNSFSEDFQDLITRYAWGEIWTRPGLLPHTRSLITLALMTALNCQEEFSMHVHAALRNGVSRDEIKEVLLQCAIYCGVPAANNSFRLAQQVFAQIDAAGAGSPHPSGDQVRGKRAGAARSE